MSDIKVNCPHCQQPLEVPEEMLGTIAACPSCNGQIQLPPLQAEIRTNTVLQQPKIPQPKQRVIVRPSLQKAPIKPPLVQNRQQPKQTKAMLAVIAALVVVILCLVAVIVILLSRKTPAQSPIADKVDTLPASSNLSNVEHVTDAKNTSLSVVEPKVQKTEEDEKKSVSQPKLDGDRRADSVSQAPATEPSNEQMAVNLVNQYLATIRRGISGLEEECTYIDSKGQSLYKKQREIEMDRVLNYNPAKAYCILNVVKWEILDVFQKNTDIIIMCNIQHDGGRTRNWRFYCVKENGAWKITLITGG